MTTVAPFVAKQILAGIPEPVESSVVKWAEEFVQPFGARGNKFDSQKTPWTVEPMERTDDGVTRFITFVKPIQTGGSVVGEVAVCRWLSVHSGGDIQWNWEDDVKAGERWDKRLKRILKNCAPVRRRWPLTRHLDKRGLIIFPHCALTVQGVQSKANMASDSIRFQCNEEIHNWKSGKLKQAYGRTTAYWNSIVLNISNAGDEHSELHEALLSGTNQPWQVKCPGCGKFHAMRTRWEPERPDLGGLRYDADGCRTETGYNYEKMLSSIRLQMPCGAEVREDIRRQLSLTGRYGEPTNPGALLTNRSFTLEAVSIDYIPFVTLIAEKHAALKALKSGDPGPWRAYVTERECRFWNPEDRPLTQRIVINTAIKKDREGLRGHPKFYGRFFALDYQQGESSKGEFPHWWIVIRDVLETGESLLVFEGKEETDGNAEETLFGRHKCVGRLGAADSGHSAKHVYHFCMRNGINAIKGGGSELYAHKDKGKRIYSEDTPLHLMAQCDPKYDYRVYADGIGPHEDEPMFWLYSKPGIRERLHYLRHGGGVKWEVPGDVSETYQKHMESEQLESEQVGRTKQVVTFFRQVRKRNDLYVCECYIAMLMERAGLIGAIK
jgi:Phage terminase large subunit (GpA)